MSGSPLPTVMQERSQNPLLWTQVPWMVKTGKKHPGLVTVVCSLAICFMLCAMLLLLPQKHDLRQLNILYLKNCHLAGKANESQLVNLVRDEQGKKKPDCSEL